MPISLRRATVDDVDIIQHHRDSMFLDMGVDAAHVAASHDGGRAWLAEHLRDGGYTGILAVDDAGQDGATVVGGVGVVWLDLPPNALTTIARRAYVLNMYVEAEYRRQGLARRLLAEAIEHVRDEGVDYVVLHASDEGRGLYESVGFAGTNEMRLLLT